MRPAGVAAALLDPKAITANGAPASRLRSPAHFVAAGGRVRRTAAHCGYGGGGGGRGGGRRGPPSGGQRGLLKRLLGCRPLESFLGGGVGAGPSLPASRSSLP